MHLNLLVRRLFSAALACAAAASIRAAAPDPSIVVRDPVLALVHARVVDGLGHPARENQTLILRGGRIAWVGPDAEARAPADAVVRDLTGKTVLPGFVLVHEHMYYSLLTPNAPFHVAELEYSFPRMYLAAGITSARTGGSIEPYTDLQLKRRIDAGEQPGPKLHLTAPYLEGVPAAVPQIDSVDSPADAARMVNYWADEGFTSFKAYMHLRGDALAAVVAAAHARHLQVTGHLGTVSYRRAAEIGIDNLEHGFFAMSDFTPNWKDDDQPNVIAAQKAAAALDLDSPAVQGLIRLLIERKVAVTSTLAIMETFNPGCRIMTTAELDTLSAPARENYLARWAKVNSRPRGEEARAWTNYLELEKRFFRAGGLLVAGTDPTGYGGVIAGYGSWRTIELLVDTGLTPVEAIQVATSNGAKLLGIDHETGSIEAGKAADLVIVAGNPAAQITDLRKTELVFKDGVGYDSRALFASVRGCVGVQ